MNNNSFSILFLYNFIIDVINKTKLLSAKNYCLISMYRINMVINLLY